mgnify:FL=1
MGKGSSASPAERPLSQEEKDLISTQEDALKQSMDVYTKQFNLSETDRAYFDKIYRGDLDPNDPKVKEEVAKRLQDTPKPTLAEYQKIVKSTSTDEYGNTTSTETRTLDQASYDAAMKTWDDNKAKIVSAVSSDLGGKGVDEALFESVMASDTKIQTAFADWQSKAQTLGTNYTDSLSGLSKDFTSKLTDTTSKLNTDISNISQGLTSGLSATTQKLDSELRAKQAELDKALKSGDKQLANKLTKETQTLSSNLKTEADKYGLALSSEGTLLASGLTSATQSYTDRMNQLSGSMGTANADVYAQTKGQNLAGISQSYAEARKQLEGTLAQRGMSDSGVGIGALSSSYNQEAMAKANATSTSYQQAIQQSDVIRQSQMGALGQVYGANTNLANQIYGANTNAAGSIYGTNTGVANALYGANTGVANTIYGNNANTANTLYGAGTNIANTAYGANANLANTVYGTDINASNAIANNTSNLANTVYNTQAGIGSQIYGIQSGLDTASLQNTLNANQQNIANLTSMSGVSQGVYGGASNYLNQSGQTAGQAAATAGSTAVGIGNTNVSWANAQTAANAAETSAMYGAIGTAAGMGAAAMSDFRFKNNIAYVETINGVKYYTWEWNDFAKEYMTEEKLYEPYGVIAQELRITNPELVFEDENGYLFVDYTSLKEI